MDPEDAEVKAAGCVAWRQTTAPTATAAPTIEVAIVHRPHYDDWSLPKGKLDPGETWEIAALRELHEETGLEGTLDEPLSPVAYTDHKGRSKTVRYWLVEARQPVPFAPNDEVDLLVWATLEDAAARVSYPTDAGVLAEASTRLSVDPPTA